MNEFATCYSTTSSPHDYAYSNITNAPLDKIEPKKESKVHSLWKHHKILILFLAFLLITLGIIVLISLGLFTVIERVAPAWVKKIVGKIKEANK